MNPSRIRFAVCFFASFAASFEHLETVRDVCYTYRSNTIDFISPLLAKPKGTISLHSVRLSACPSVCLSIRLSVIPLSVFRTFLCSGWGYSTEIWYMTTSQCVTDQVWVLLHLTNFWLNYSPWCSHLVFRTFFALDEVRNLNFFYIVSSWIVIYQVRVSVHLTFFWLNYGPWCLAINQGHCDI
jgi:hypothetical protein